MRRLWLHLSLCAASLLGGFVAEGSADTSASRLPAPLQTAAFVNVNLVPMTDERVVRDQTVLVEEGRITAIGPSDKTEIPSGAVIIDGRGAYLVPGLADMHMHTGTGWLDGTWPVSPFALYLANGVTTIRNLGAGGPSFKQPLIWRDQIARGELAGPRMFVGSLLGREPVKDVRSFVEWSAAERFDFIKPYSFLTRLQFERTMRAAESVGMRTVGHIPFAVGLDGVLSGSMDEIAHIEELDFELLDFDRTQRLHPREWFKFLTELGARHTAPFETADGLDLQRYNLLNPGRISGIIDRLRAMEVPITTTLVVGETIVKKLLHKDAYLAQPENRYLPAAYWAGFNDGRERFARSKFDLETMFLRELHKAGIPIVLGTDAGTGAMGIVPGFSIHDELRILTENGFTPYEALVTATRTASKVASGITGAEEFGTIELGKRADLLLVHGDPLADVANLRDPVGVMAAGRWYPRVRLRAMIGVEG